MSVVTEPASKRRRASQSIAMRLGVLLTLVLAAAVAAVMFATYRYGRSAADQAFDRLLTGAALQISERISVVDGKPVVDIPVSAFELMSLAHNDRIFYRVVGPHGATLTGYDDFPLPSGPPSDSHRRVYETTYDGVPVRAVALSRDLAERSLSGRVEVIVAHTMRARMALAREIVTPAITGIAAASLAVLALALLAMRYALRPLERIERAIIERDPSDLTPFDMATPREVEALVDAINRFMGRLDRRLRTMQSFVADAAHQMRTPITALRAQTELALREHDVNRLRVLQRRIRARAIGVGRLTDQLLSHALITHRSETAPLAPIDLRRAAVDAEREFHQAEGGNAGDILLDLCEEPVMVRGDLFSLREATKNLINNALKHGKPPVSIRVGAAEGGRCRLSVQDRGAGFEDPDGTAGERFAHNENNAESAGLGLAIVREVANSHHGRLTSERLGGDGFRIMLDLPEWNGKTR